MMKKLGVDQVLIVKPVRKSDNPKSFIALFKNEEVIYQKTLLDNFKGLKEFIKNLQNEFKAKNPTTKNIGTSVSLLKDIERNEYGKITREIEYQVDGTKRKLSSIKKYDPETETLKSTTFFQKNDDKKLASIVKYDSKTGNIYEKIAYYDDGKNMLSLSTFEPETGNMLKVKTFDKKGDCIHTVKYCPEDGSKLEEEFPKYRVRYNKKGGIIEKSDYESEKSMYYDSEGRLYEIRNWGLPGHTIEEYDVYTGNLVKETDYFSNREPYNIKEYNPEAPGHLLKKTEYDRNGDINRVSRYRSEPPHTRYQEVEIVERYGWGSRELVVRLTEFAIDGRTETSTRKCRTTSIE